MASSTLDVDAGARAQDVRLFVEVALNALCRVEQKGDPTTSQEEAWRSYAGELGIADFIELRIRDAAIPYPWLFSVEHVIPGTPTQELRCLSDDAVQRLIDRAEPRASMSPDDFLRWAAERLLPPGPKWGPSLPTVTSDQVVLELPGTGGLFAYRMLQDSPGVFLQDNFVIACGTWQEAMSAGLVALESGVPSGVALRVAIDPDLESNVVRGHRYDMIVGGRDASAGIVGRLDDLLAPDGEVVLV